MTEKLKLSNLRHPRGQISKFLHLIYCFIPKKLSYRLALLRCNFRGVSAVAMLTFHFPSKLGDRVQ